MKFDTSSENIILISYPSGGFGNFLYYVLSEFAKETVKVSNSKFHFSKTGNSHSVYVYTNSYYHDPEIYDNSITVNTEANRILVLCDNGINNDSYTKINKIFPNAKKLRIVIDDNARPVIYKTLNNKAVEFNHHDVNIDQIRQNWKEDEFPFLPYCVRENFTLLYRNWPFAWHSDDSCINVSMEQLITNPCQTLLDAIERLNLTAQNVESLKELCDKWLSENLKYIDIYNSWKIIDQANYDVSLTHIDDLHDQGYINYRIEKKFNIEIKVYDYRDWFATTGDIIRMIEYEKDLIVNQ